MYTFLLVINSIIRAIAYMLSRIETLDLAQSADKHERAVYVRVCLLEILERPAI